MVVVEEEEEKEVKEDDDDDEEEEDEKRRRKEEEGLLTVTEDLPAPTRSVFNLNRLTLCSTSRDASGTQISEYWPFEAIATDILPISARQLKAVLHDVHTRRTEGTGTILIDADHTQFAE